MTTKHKITMFSTLCLAILSSVIFFDNTDEIAKHSKQKTEKKFIVEKQPTIIPKKQEKTVIVDDKKIPKPKEEKTKKNTSIVQKKEKTESKTVSDKNSSIVTFQPVSKEKVTEEMVSDLSKDIFPKGSSIQDYMEKHDDYKFFKADLNPIFKAKVGDEVVINIFGKEYKGTLTESETELPDKEVFGEDYEDTTFSYWIQLGKPYARISIDGIKTPDGHYFYEAEIIDEDNMGLDKQFFINNDIGIVVSRINYQYLYYDPNIEYEY